MTGGPNPAPAQRARYWARKAGGLCVRCGAGLTDEDGLRCPECTKIIATYRRSDKGKAAARLACKRWRARRRASTADGAVASRSSAPPVEDLCPST